jgi:hypothetical protein
MQDAEAELRAQIADFHRMFFANQAGAAVPIV